MRGPTPSRMVRRRATMVALLLANLVPLPGQRASASVDGVMRQAQRQNLARWLAPSSR